MQAAVMLGEVSVADSPAVRDQPELFDERPRHGLRAEMPSAL